MLIDITFFIQIAHFWIGYTLLVHIFLKPACALVWAHQAEIDQLVKTIGDIEYSNQHTKSLMLHELEQTQQFLVHSLPVEHPSPTIFFTAPLEEFTHEKEQVSNDLVQALIDQVIHDAP